MHRTRFKPHSLGSKGQVAGVAGFYCGLVASDDATHVGAVTLLQFALVRPDRKRFPVNVVKRPGSGIGRISMRIGGGRPRTGRLMSADRHGIVIVC